MKTCSETSSEGKNDNLQIKKGGKEIIDMYTALLKKMGIVYIPAKYEYINFHKKYKEYLKTLTHNEIKKLMFAWFRNKIGAWCGYKLSNFWGDISKIQVNKNNSSESIIQKFINGEI
jgi:hypothetical protein